MVGVWSSAGGDATTSPASRGTASEAEDGVRAGVVEGGWGGRAPGFRIWCRELTLSALAATQTGKGRPGREEFTSSMRRAGEERDPRHSGRGQGEGGGWLVSGGGGNRVRAGGAEVGRRVRAR